MLGPDPKRLEFQLPGSAPSPPGKMHRLSLALLLGAASASPVNETQLL
jgi:hypothetical protein